MTQLRYIIVVISIIILVGVILFLSSDLLILPLFHSKTVQIKHIVNASNRRVIKTELRDIISTLVEKGKIY